MKLRSPSAHERPYSRICLLSLFSVESLVRPLPRLSSCTFLAFAFLAVESVEMSAQFCVAPPPPDAGGSSRTRPHAQNPNTLQALPGSCRDRSQHPWGPGQEVPKINLKPHAFLTLNEVDAHPRDGGKVVKDVAAELGASPWNERHRHQERGTAPAGSRLGTEKQP